MFSSNQNKNIIYDKKYSITSNELDNRNERNLEFGEVLSSLTHESMYWRSLSSSEALQ